MTTAGSRSRHQPRVDSRLENRDRASHPRRLLRYHGSDRGLMVPGVYTQGLGCRKFDPPSGGSLQAEGQR